MESEQTYPERSAGEFSLKAEVSRGHSRLGDEPSERTEGSRTAEGLNVRIRQRTTMIYHESEESRNTLENWSIER